MSNDSHDSSSSNYRHLIFAQDGHLSHDSHLSHASKYSGGKYSGGRLLHAHEESRRACERVGLFQVGPPLEQLQGVVAGRDACEDRRGEGVVGRGLGAGR